MATALVSLKTTNSLTGVPGDHTQESEVLNGTVTLTAASTYVTNGLPVPWTKTTNSAGAGLLPQSNQTVPYDADFTSKGGNGSGYTYQWDSVHNTLRIFLAGTEVANGAAIPALVYADLIFFRAYFRKA
jgi:hypothetical protein